jgi:hypothetical protein
VVRDFFTAWAGGNTLRMKALSVSGFTEDWLKLHTKLPDNYTVTLDNAVSDSIYDVLDIDGSDLSHYVVRVKVALLGQPRAIGYRPE